MGLGPLKYYGHWPFTRLFGLEEPASVLFSLLNGVPYLLALAHSITRHGTFGSVHVNTCQDSSPASVNLHFMHRWLVVYYSIGLNAWLASAFYHARKTDNATFYDYISALLFLVLTLWLALRRVWGQGAKGYVVSAIFTLFVGLYVFQVYRMHLGQVTFGAHMGVCIGISVVNVIMWLLWLVFTPSTGNYRYLCLVTQVWFSVAALLEIFDFPAIWGYFDAHSLWHAATIPLGFIWWTFWRLDCENTAVIMKQS
jgi:post-GPI attachment to proteins factor 3